MARRITEAKFPKVKTLEEFHFDEAPIIPAAQILLERIEGVAPAGESLMVRLPATLKVRESSKVMRRGWADDR